MKLNDYVGQKIHKFEIKEMAGDDALIITLEDNSKITFKTSNTGHGILITPYGAVKKVQYIHEELSDEGVRQTLEERIKEREAV